MPKQPQYHIGQVVRHRLFAFRGIIYDVDPVYSNTEDWWLAIPEDMRPDKDQPYYHLLAENEETTYEAYVSQQNLLPDTSGSPVEHPRADELFIRLKNGQYSLRPHNLN